MRRDSPPLAGTIHKCETFEFAARSTSSQSNTTHLPFGDGTGAPTRFSFIMSSNVKGCFCDGVCASRELANERMIARNILISRKTLTEARDVQQPFRERTPLACWRLRMLSRVANFAAMPQLALSFKGNKVCSGKMRQ